MLSEQELNALSAAKKDATQSFLSNDRAFDPAEAAWAVNTLYRESTGEACPEIRMAAGLKDAAAILQRYTERANASVRKNMADVLFKAAVTHAENCRAALSEAFPGEVLGNLSNMVFRDLNFKMSRSIAEPLLSALRKAGELPQQYVLRSSAYPSIQDADWISYYEIVNRVLHTFIPVPEPFKAFLTSGSMQIFAFSDVAIVVPRPFVLRVDESCRLHGEGTAAAAWEDGTKLYFHNGVAVPEKPVERPDEVTREDIIAEENAEVRRCYQEILGSERFAKCLGLVAIDSDTDRFGHDMTLYRTRDKDKLAGDYIRFAGVTCPSTQRRYFLCVPPHISSAAAAVAWSFGKTPKDYRPETET